ncbi:MAG TPA: hypothetical protein VG714_05980 [Acidobacteriaceae bacterium]|nr:hypothetical protein [Acidobacteriaceae bacterium]
MPVRAFIFCFVAVPLLASAQVPVATDQPLPDITALMHDVEANQRKAEAIEKDYIYHSVTTQQEHDSDGKVKKTTVIGADNYWLEGVPVTRVTSKDGKPLSDKELAKEDRRIEKDVAKAKERRAKADSEGKPTDPRGEDLVTVSRLLELGAFIHPRRVQIGGRSAIAVDFAGDPKAKTRNRMEEVIRDMAGTAWIDEQDRMLVRVEGRFVDNFKIGAGLFANIRKGTHFTAQMTKINGEVWLPEEIQAEGAARFLLFWNFNGRVEIRFSDYRKFRTSSVILPTPSR